MPNQEKPQGFELIELLIREAGSNAGASPSTSTQQGSDFESFKARFQSYIDQIPSYLHSVGKEGFFPHFFLGSFSTLIGTEIAKKLDIEKIYFSFDGSKTLKVAVIRKGGITNQKSAIEKVNLFVISEFGKNDSKSKKFTYGELEEILGQSNLPAQNEHVRSAKDDLKVKLVKIVKATGEISVEVKDDKLDKNTSATHEFKEIKKGLWNNPESDIAKLTNPDVEKVKKPVENILKKVSKIHSEYKNSLTYAQGTREAAHHGFVAGVLVNFRYRHNLRVYLEQFAGRGYADIVLVPRGKERALYAIPIAIELKAATKQELKEGKIGEKSKTTPAAALKQAEDYTKGFQPNVMRILTTANDMLCVGVNLDHPSPVSNIVAKSRDQKSIPLFNDILGSIDERNSGKIDEGELKKQIQNNIERVYHTFPGTGEKGDNHYFSRFLLGQSLLLNEVKDLKTSFEKHIFVYEENVPTEVRLESKGRGIHQRQAAKKADEKLAESSRLDESHAVVTMVFVPESDKKSAYVMNIVESDGKAEILKKGIPLNKLKQKIGNRKIVELNLNFNIKEQKSDFKKYFSVEVNEPISLGEYNGKKSDKFKGDFKNVPYPKDFKKTFDEVLVSQLASLQDQSSSIGKYKKLFGKVGEAILPLKGLIEKEAHTQAVLHGAFDHYSDIKLGEPQQEDRALILTEFQTGRGKRIDMLVHGIKFANQASSAKEYDPVGLEVKGPREGKTADALITEANNQITKEYTKGVTYKTLTDGNKVAFMGVIFDKGASNTNSLILVSKDEFTPVKVVHSSIFSFSQCVTRKRRDIGIPCIDSRDEEKVTEEEKEQRIKELFNAEKVAERVKNIEFYDQLFKVSQKISEGEIIDKNVEEAFVAKIKDIDLGSIDPEIRDIVKEMKDNIENKEEVKNILRRSGVAEKIGKVAEGAGLAFTAFLVGKHIANGDIEGLGYDALNLWVMPKIGEKISGKMLELGTKLDSQMLKEFAPVMGRAIGNFAAFLGLAESIKARQNATDPADIKIADLNIATNSIFIATDVPAVITETMSAIGMEAGVVGEFAGPVGAAVSVAVIIISQFVEAGLEVEKLGEQMSLTDQEKHDLYWDFFLGKKVPDYIESDLQAKEIYKQYISTILDNFDKDSYTQVVMSLPSILIKKEEYATNSYSRSKRQWEGIGIGMLKARSLCNRVMRIISTEFDFEQEVRAKYPFYNIEIARNFNRVVPSTIGSYNLVCGPQGDDVAKQIVSTQELAKLPVNCDPYDNESKGNQGAILKKIVERWFLQEHMTDCYNAVSYNRSDPSGPVKMLFYMSNNNAFINVTSNYAIDVIFNGKNILLNSYGINNQGSGIQNRYYFINQLSNCDIHKQGTNFFYIAKDNFVCNLGGSSIGQNNIVVTRSNFTDSENIHSIIGNDKANYIEVSHASYVDGKGGNDVITAKNFTTIKGYFGDSIHGKGLVLLPINLSDIGNITHANNITNIYNKSGAFISVDKQTSVKTADGLSVTPTKVDTNTGRVTNLHVTKSIGSNVVLDDELDNLRKIDNLNFNVTKQLSSTNYHSTIGSSGNNIFYPDKEHHNFYWEAPSNISHLYLFDNRNANITIAQANGILDFSQLNCTLNNMPFIENDKGEIKINKNGLNVTLLPDYKDVTVTFDGEEYYKFQNRELERDYCSHSLRIDGRFSVNGTNLLNHHNCFTFDSDRVLFLKLNNDLLLLSDRGALSISNYYYSVHKNWDLSVELNNRVMEPEEFGERAEDFSSFRYYKSDEQGLQIYHNQPINKNDIGLVDLKGKSILDFDMKVMNDTLLLSHKNNTPVKLENWNTYQPAREMIFAFNDTIVSNSKCIVSTCNSEDVVMDFNKEKIILQISNSIKQNNIDAKDKDGKTLFHIVANKGDLSSAKLLVGKVESVSFEESVYAEPDELVKAVRQRERLKSLINEKDKFGYTPLQYAAKNGKWDIVNLFLDKTAERNQDDVADKDKFSTSWTTVHYAVYNGNMSLFNDIFQFLSDKETMINTKDSSDWTPLHYAVYYNALDVVKFLVNKGADISVKDKDSKTPLDLAAQENDTNVAEFLKQTELDKKLLAAVQDAGLNEVKDLINQKANINAKDMYGWTPLHFAASRDKLSVVEFLFNNNANINAKDVYGNTPLHVAAQYSSSLEIVKFLLDKDISGINNITNNGWTPLHVAIQGNKLNTVELLLGRGADIEVRDIYNQTSLDLATRKGYLDIAGILKQVQLDRKLLTIVESGGFNEAKGLIAQGANIDTNDKNGNTLLYSAAEIGDLNLVKLLLDNGANIEAKNGEYQVTPLHGAVENYRIDVVKLLLNRGANVNAEDKDNWTPLHYGADTNSLDIVKVLVDAHANLGAKGNYGKTPLDIAKDKGHNNIVEYLEKKLRGGRGERKRRHHHGDHNSHNLSRKPLAIDQPQIATSSGAKPSSWINDCISWVKSSVGRLLSSKSEGTASSVSQVDGQFAKALISNSSFTGTTLPSYMLKTSLYKIL